MSLLLEKNIAAHSAVLYLQNNITGRGLHFVVNRSMLAWNQREYGDN